MAAQIEDDPNVIEWDVKREINLFEAMMGYKPVGVNRHFMMACIHSKLCKILDRQITSVPIWKHFDTMYDMAALHESEIIPFPNEEGNFQLNEEYEDLFFEKFGIPLFHNEKSDGIIFDGKKIAPSKMKQTTSPVSSGKVSGNSSKITSSISTTPSIKANKAIKNDSNGETLEINIVKMDSPIPGKSVKSKRLSTPEIKIKQEVQSNVQVKVQNVSDLEVKKMKVDTPSSKKVVERKTELAESAKKSKDVSNSKKGKQIVNSESSGNRRSGKIESTPLKRKFEGTVSEKNSTSKSDRSESEFQKSIGASKMPRTSSGKVDVDAKRRTRTKTEDATTPKNTPTAKRRR